MGLVRAHIDEPYWDIRDFAEICTHNLFSNDRWGYTVPWHILLEQAQKIKSIALLLDPYYYETTLFPIYIDILEANLYIFDDMFYYLVGVRIGNEPDLEKFLEEGTIDKISSRLLFWNLNCRDSVLQIKKELVFIEKQIMAFLKQRGLEYIYNRVVDVWTNSYKFDDPDYNTTDGGFYRDRSFGFATEAYFKPKFSPSVKKQFVNQIVNVLNFLENDIMVFCWGYDLPLDSFPILLEQFRNSEKGQIVIKSWERDFNGSRDSLIAKMEKIPELQPWVHRCLHLHDEAHAIEQLFYDEYMVGIVNEEEYYNTNNWIIIIKIVTILKEYDARQKKTVSKGNKKSRDIKTFREFINDSERTDEVLEKLHRLIGNKKNTEALRVIVKLMWIELISRPTATSIKKEFPSITCSSQQISKCLNEPRPTHDTMLKKIWQEYEHA